MYCRTWAVLSLGVLMVAAALAQDTEAQAEEQVVERVAYDPVDADTVPKAPARANELGRTHCFSGANDLVSLSSFDPLSGDVDVRSVWDRATVRQSGDVQFKVVPYALPSQRTVEAQSTSNEDAYGEMSIVSQCSVDRIPTRLASLAQAWDGPVSLAVLLSQQFWAAELLEVVYLHQMHPHIQRNVDIHLVMEVDVSEEWSMFAESKLNGGYPINMLRNIALKYSRSEWLFVADIDVLPSETCAEFTRAINELENGYRVREMMSNSACPELVSYVIPILQFKTPATAFPNGVGGGAIPKSNITSLLTGEKLSVMFPNAPDAYFPTDYAKWLVTTDPYTVEYIPMFEPYYVARRHVPLWSEKFIGRGNNFAEQVQTQYFGGYTFVVAPSLYCFDIPTMAGGRASWSGKHNQYVVGKIASLTEAFGVGLDHVETIARAIEVANADHDNDHEDAPKHKDAPQEEQSLYSMLMLSRSVIGAEMQQSLRLWLSREVRRATRG